MAVWQLYLCYHYGMNELRWWYYEFKRLKRWWMPEQSVRKLVDAVGAFWLWRNGARREFRIRLWSGSAGWYAPDIAFPHLLKAIEADDPTHKKRVQEDRVRDFRLNEKGWQILHITQAELTANPRAVRRRVRRFIKS